MLRFLIDLRGEEVDNKQMRDDLITLLIAGHETTAAVLTWLTYALSQHPEALKVVQVACSGWLEPHPTNECSTCPLS